MVRLMISTVHSRAQKLSSFSEKKKKKELELTHDPIKLGKPTRARARFN